MQEPTYPYESPISKIQICRNNHHLRPRQHDRIEVVETRKRPSMFKRRDILLFIRDGGTPCGVPLRESRRSPGLEYCLLYVM